MVCFEWEEIRLIFSFQNFQVIFHHTILSLLFLLQQFNPFTFLLNESLFSHLPPILTLFLLTVRWRSHLQARPKANEVQASRRYVCTILDVFLCVRDHTHTHTQHTHIYTHTPHHTPHTTHHTHTTRPHAHNTHTHTHARVKFGLCLLSLDKEHILTNSLTDLHLLREVPTWRRVQREVPLPPFIFVGAM